MIKVIVFLNTILCNTSTSRAETSESKNNSTVPAAAFAKAVSTFNCQCEHIGHKNITPAICKYPQQINYLPKIRAVRHHTHTYKHKWRVGANKTHISCVQ